MVKKKVKVKEWYLILLPEVFVKREVGRTLAAEPSSLIGRKISLSILELVENTSKYYLKFNFVITRVDGNQAFTEFHGAECLQDYISRMVVRRVRRIDTIQDLKTKDGIELRVKSIAILPRKAKSSIEKKISFRIKELLKEDVENSTVDEFIKKLITDEIKSRVLTECRKIYPMRNFEVRKVERLSPI